jgi:iron complex transport system ATP-binding protein
MDYELKGLTTGYHTKKGDRVVSHGLTARLQAGELTCLLGPNGAGKSTLLRTLAAFQPPLSGELLLDGRPLNSFTAQQRATRIGVVLTERPDIKGMRVREMVAMGRSPYTGFWGGLSAQDEAAVNDAIRQVGIRELERRMLHTLSDGEQQKVMIAKALAQQTPIIFLDEPTAFLDFPSKVEMMLLLRRLAREMQKTIFLSTHDLELALQIADSLWLMGNGRAIDDLGLMIDEYNGTSSSIQQSAINKDQSAVSKNESVNSNLQSAICNQQSFIIGTPRQLADSGDLARFFSGTGITFDVTHLRFHIQC